MSFCSPVSFFISAPLYFFSLILWLYNAGIPFSSKFVCENSSEVKIGASVFTGRLNEINSCGAPTAERHKLLLNLRNNHYASASSCMVSIRIYVAHFSLLLSVLQPRNLSKLKCIYYIILFAFLPLFRRHSSTAVAINAFHSFFACETAVNVYNVYGYGWVSISGYISWEIFLPSGCEQSETTHFHLRCHWGFLFRHNQCIFTF